VSNLVSLIREEIERHGPIPFVRFMEQTLYHPEYGYYSSPKEKLGPKGDYYTSPLVHSVFAKLLAKQIRQMADSFIADNEPITLIEFGAGTGLLCQKIIESFREQGFPLHRLRYIIIERSRSFIARQKERLLPYADRVQWKETIPSCTGIVFSNELIDAFPVHRIRVVNGLAHEIYIDWKGDRFVEQLIPVTSGPLHDYIDRVAIPLDHVVDFEINLLALDWIRSVGAALTKGFVMTIDYGYPAEQLYSATRKKGTFLCYHHHTVNEAPYERVGEQDMTSHVDFTSFAAAGEKAGLSVCGFTDQSHFLMGLGITDEMQQVADQMEQSESARKDFLAMKQLMAPDRMGKTFKILIQGKGVDAAVFPLDGLRFKAFSKEMTSLS
jgi:SAM-dependent MidA family methyltransferase